jgi:hypothetical protein
MESILYSVKLTIGQNSPRITLARKVWVFVLVSREAKVTKFQASPIRSPALDEKHSLQGEEAVTITYALE